MGILPRNLEVLEKMFFQMEDRRCVKGDPHGKRG